jgi:peptide/nickel transport system substrate-binding protein
MEKAVTDGKLAFSRSDAASKNVDWMSLIIPDDANILKANLEDFAKERLVPPALGYINDSSYFGLRYNASASWIAQHGHAVISNGPYYLDNYSPEARKITINAFSDPTYPFKAGYWKKFEEISIPKIENVIVPTSITLGSTLNIPVSVTPNSTVYYYFTDSQGKIVDNGKQISTNGSTVITLGSDKTRNLGLGSNDFQMFVVSDAAYKPDMYHTSFLVTKGENQLSLQTLVAGNGPLAVNYVYLASILVAVGIVMALVFVVIKRRMR